jgi:hypothetical protein
MPARPGPSEPPFRVTLHCSDGKARTFPLYADAAYDNIEQSRLMKDRPYGDQVFEHMDERDILLGASIRLFTSFVERGSGVFTFTDDDGHEWGFPARSVIAVEIEDPEADMPKQLSRIGFQPVEIARPGEPRPPLRLVPYGAEAEDGA